MENLETLQAEIIEIKSELKQLQIQHSLSLIEQSMDMLRLVELQDKLDKLEG